MSGIYLHSPHQPCSKDCSHLSPCLRKGERVIIRGSPIMACIHTADNVPLLSPSESIASPRPVCKTPSKTSHTKDCPKKVPLLHCPFGRCEQKFEDIFQHFRIKHDFIKVILNMPLVYRLKNIIRDVFIMYEHKNDVFFLGNIEESYQRDINFEMQVIPNYTKNCCGHPKFVFSIPGVVNNYPIDIYKNKFTIGKTMRKLMILKDNLRKTDGLKMYYDIKIIIKKKS